ncbi:hypothetical protein GCM10020000_36160 [Streptomyces olivoverticillatus]
MAKTKKAKPDKVLDNAPEQQVKGSGKPDKGSKAAKPDKAAKQSKSSDQGKSSGRDKVAKAVKKR